MDDFFIQENALCRSLAVCLHKNEKSSFTLLLKIFVYFILMMGRAGLGPPNSTVLLNRLFVGESVGTSHIRAHEKYQ